MKYLFVFLLVGLVSCGDDATGDATGDAKNEIAKQPDCKDIEGLQIADRTLVPEDYTGVAFKCVDGKVKWLYNYKDGNVSLGRRWYENGQLSYEENDKDGLYRSWNENGQLTSEKNDKDGKMVAMVYFENGQLSYITNAKYGKLDGLIRYWYENGQMFSESNYKDGEHVGLSRTWHENGQLAGEWNFNDGVIISEKCWDEDGNQILCSTE